MEVSAKFVLNTIFLTFLLFLKTKFCSSFDKDECNGIMINFPVFGERNLLSFNRSFNAIISANPGKNIYKCNIYFEKKTIIIILLNLLTKMEPVLG